MNLKLKMRILKRGLSQIQLAANIGVTDAYLSRVVRGWVNPSPEVKGRLASALNCPVEKIFKKMKE